MQSWPQCFAARLAVLALAGAPAACLQTVPTEADAYLCQTSGACQPATSDATVTAADATADTADLGGQPDTPPDGPARTDSATANKTAAADADAAPPSDAPDAPATPDIQVPDTAPDGGAAPTDSSGGATGAGDATATDAGPLCATACDDGNPCSKDSCDNGLCVHLPLSTGTCTDGDLCTSSDSCQNGACTGTKKLCAAVDGCHDAGVCNPGSGVCSAPTSADGKVCSDGNPCTVGDACQYGVCLPKGITDCEDGDPCTTSSCKPTTGCLYAASPGGEPCADKDPCTEKELCKAGKCSGAASACTDGNPCTADYCDSLKGCVGIPAPATCSDGDACTSGDACNQGACLPGAATPDCDDKNVCTNDTCKAAGGCAHQNVGLACEDGEKCTVGDNCASGKCAPGPWKCQCVADKDCDNGNACTAFACQAGACVYTNKTGACDDKNACVSDEACASGKCAGGKAVSCDDSEICTADSCDSVKGCLHAPTAPLVAVCAGVVVNGRCYSCIATPSAVQAAAEASCTAASADSHLASIASKAEHAAVIAARDKGCAAKTAWIGLGNNGQGAGAKWTDGTALGYTNWNGAAPALGNPFVTYVGAALGYWGTGGLGVQAGNAVCERPFEVACNDNTVCTTTSYCQGGKCAAGFAHELCDDGNPCTTDSCDPIKDCVAVAQPDGSVCAAASCAANQWKATAICKAAVCTGPAAKSCDDGNLCTDDLCDAAAGCSSAAGQATACTDGNPCTTGDTCSSGVCKPGSGALACDDGNACTDDKCDAAKGCTATSKASTAAPCTGVTWNNHCYEAFLQAIDFANYNGKCAAAGGSLATIHSAGENAQVLQAAKLVCNGLTNFAYFGMVQANPTVNGTEAWLDSSPLTYSNWYPGEPNLVNEPYGGLYLSDGSWNDFLAVGGAVCQVCERSLGAACTDASICTQGDGCSNGACTGVALSCDDKNGCTVDACDPKLGCSYTTIAEGGACAGTTCDGQKLATGSVCTGGLCKQVSPKTCDDGNACTPDSCDAVKGVCSVGIAKVCTDNNPCTDDTCANNAQDCSFPSKSDGAASCKGTMWRGHCYEVGAGSNMVQAAMTQDCTNKGGSLATIHSSDENEVVRAALAKTCTTNTEGYMGLIQSGATNALGHKWGNGQPVSYTNWKAGEPSSDSEIYTAINKNSGQWNDNNPGTGTACWICERIPGTTCEDNNACTLGDVCLYSGCTGVPQTCDDNQPCTLDSCSSSAGCATSVKVAGSQYQPLFCDGTNSGKQCTSGGVCEAAQGACSGKTCGYDGKLGDCGKCDASSVCSAAGQCVAGSTYAKTDQVLVSGGAFSMGCSFWNDNQCSGNVLPHHVVYVSSFYLDTYEVSQAKYKSCVGAGKCAAFGYQGVDDTSPIVALNWDQAQSYCKWVGGDLPTEAQWEYAARAISKGVSPSIYPWGNLWPPPSLANIGNTGITELADPYGYVHPASLCYEKNALGICNMVGNVSEWVRDYFSDTYYAVSPVKDPINTTAAVQRSFRGMSWFYSLIGEAAVFARFWYTPTASYTNVGVRCSYPFAN